MQVTKLDAAEPRPRRVAVGEFDGVHLGHREVIRGSDTVLTFEPHPLQVVRPEAAPKLLTSFDVKAELIAELGVEELVVIPFDSTLRRPDAAGVRRPRAGRPAAGHARVGRRELPLRPSRRRRSADAGAPTPRFETRVVPLVEVDGEIVSSSHIRALVQAGEVERGRADARRAVPAARRGRAGRSAGTRSSASRPPTSFPTRRSCTRATASTWRAPTATCAAVNVGVRPTFGTGRAVLVEAYLLDRDVDLYGQILRVDFLARLRGERRFDSVDALVEQMRRDVEQARELCG